MSVVQFPAYRYVASVVHVVDGDTIDLDVQLGFHVQVRERFRLLGVDAPEMHGADAPEGKKARSFVEEILPVGTQVWIKTRKSDKYGRWLAEIFLTENDAVAGANSLSEMLLGAGHAEVY